MKMVVAEVVKMDNKEKEEKIKLLVGEKTYNDIKNLITKIETSPPTTMCHYGDYMIILEKFKGDKKLCAELLILLGGNEEGVRSALSLTI
jgi:hypothetical protein